MEENIAQVWGRGAELPCPPQNLPVFSDLVALMEVPLLKHDGLNHWPLGVELQPLCSPGRSGERAERSNPLITRTKFVPLATSCHPQKSFININSGEVEKDWLCINTGHS